MSSRKSDEHGRPTPRARAKRRTSPVAKREARYHPPVIDPGPDAHESLEPHELYRLEKARRETGDIGVNELLEEARREYIALLASDATKGKGGRPRKNAAKPAQPVDSEDIDSAG
jgi:hypothetical protein